MAREASHLRVENLPENARGSKVYDYQHFKRYGCFENVNNLPNRGSECGVSAFMDIKSAQKARGTVNIMGDRDFRMIDTEPCTTLGAPRVWDKTVSTSSCSGEVSGFRGGGEGPTYGNPQSLHAREGHYKRGPLGTSATWERSSEHSSYGHHERGTGGSEGTQHYDQDYCRDSRDQTLQHGKYYSPRRSEAHESRNVSSTQEQFTLPSAEPRDIYRNDVSREVRGRRPKWRSLRSSRSRSRSPRSSWSRSRSSRSRSRSPRSRSRSPRSSRSKSRSSRSRSRSPRSSRSKSRSSRFRSRSSRLRSCSPRSSRLRSCSPRSSRLRSRSPRSSRSSSRSPRFSRSSSRSPRFSRSSSRSPHFSRSRSRSPHFSRSRSRSSRFSRSRSRSPRWLAGQASRPARSPRSSRSWSTSSSSDSQRRSSSSTSSDSSGSSSTSNGEYAAVSAPPPRSLLNKRGSFKRLGIKVQNLPVRSTDSSLTSGLFHKFKEYGKVSSIQIHGALKERYGLVFFKQWEDQQKALNSSKGTLFFGQQIEVTSWEGSETKSENEFRPPDERIDEFHSKACRTLFIGNLEKNTNRLDLEAVFERFGEIVDIDVKKVRGVPQYAFLQYGNIRSVCKAIKKMDGKYLGKNRLKLGFGKTMPTNCVWIDGLPSGVTKQDLASYFSHYGLVLKMVYDRYKGMAMVLFDEIVSAQDAVKQTRGRKFGGNIVMVDFANPRQTADFVTLQLQDI